MAVLLSRQPLPRGRRVAVLTNAGGLGILCADACEAAGLELARADRGDSRAALERPAARGERREPGRHARLGGRRDLRGGDPAGCSPIRGVDALIVLFVPPVVAGAEEVAAAVVRACARRRGQAGARRLDRARTAMPRARRGRARSPRSTTPSRPRARSAARPSAPSGCAARPAPSRSSTGIDRARPQALVVDALGSVDGAGSTPPTGAQLLEAYGIPLVAERVAATAGEAVAAARELGFPAVVKTARAGAHKTETGGVALDLATRRRVRAAVERIGGAGARAADAQRRRRAARRASSRIPSSGRSSRSAPAACFAELIGEARLPDRPAHATSMRRSSSRRQGRAARRAATAAPARRRRRARRPRAPARAARARRCPRSPSST